MVRFIVYKIKFCLGLYSRDGSSYNLSNIILYFQYLIDSTLNSQNIDTFLENVILKQNYSCRLIEKKAFRHENECQQHPVFPGGHPSKY